ncbi:MAG: hypothetical protein MJ234_03450 [bacterium]|nr:hypothetical protein [bacterium]
MHVGINNAFISDYSITVNNEGISIKHKGNEQIYYKNEIVRLFVDSYTVGVEPEYDGFLNIGRSSSIKGYTAKKKSPNAFFITGKKEKIFRLAMVLKRGGMGRKKQPLFLTISMWMLRANKSFFLIIPFRQCICSDI